MQDKFKIVSIKGGKDNESQIVEVSKDEAVLILNGKKIDLDSFILCGIQSEQANKKDVVLSWNCSINEMLIYKNKLSIIVDDKFRESLRG